MIAQTLQETVYLKNSSVIKGEIIEQIPNQSIKIKTKDGNIFVYKMDEVEKIAKEQAPVSDFNRLYNGVEANIDMGALISTQSGGGSSFLGGIGIGKRFNDNLYLGGGAGINLSSGGGKAFPVYINPKIYFPFENSKLDLFLDARGGMSFFDGGHAGLAELLLGIQIPVSRTTDFNVGAGYLMSFSDGNTSGAIAIKTGIGFHSSTNSVSARIHKDPVPTRDNGIQLGIEGSLGKSLGTVESVYGVPGPYGINLTLGYKTNPQLSFGGGFGFDLIKESPDMFSVKANQELPIYGKDYENDIYWYSFMLYGNYRLTNNRLSPVFNLIGGIKKYRIEQQEYHYGYNVSNVSYFISPEAGLSLRTTNNSYIELKVGANLSTPLKVSEPHITFVDDKITTSSVYVKIGFAHTFKWLSK